MVGTHDSISVTPGSDCVRPGVVVGNFLPLSLAVSLGAGVALIGFSFVQTRQRDLFIGFSILALGFCNQRLQTTLLAPHDLRVLVGTNTSYITLTGTLVETPYQKFYEHRQEVNWRTLAVMDVESLAEEGKASQPAFGRVAISTPGVAGTNYYGGERFSISGVLRGQPDLWQRTCLITKVTSNETEFITNFRSSRRPIGNRKA